MSEESGFIALLLIPSLAVSLIVVVPLTGVLVRFRANYNPKGLQLDAEGGAQPHTGPVIQSYFGMMRRVWRLEGWPGLYKGLMPTFLSTILMTVMILIFLGSSSRGHGTYKAPKASILGTFLYSIGAMLLGLPTAIITYRAITTPHRLPYLRPLTSLRILLTPTERRRPWILYLTPGLLATELAHIAVVLMLVDPIRRLLVPEYTNREAMQSVAWWKLGIYFVAVVLFTSVLAPLEVIGTRLAIQRNHAGGYSSVNQEVEGDAEQEEVTEYAGAEEDVIGLRSELDPYTGLVDCAKRIIDEEGWSSLYKAWWITMLGILLSPV